MAKKTYLHRGLVTKLDSAFAKIANLFDLERWWKETANKYFVPFNDTCDEACPVPTHQPVGVSELGLQTYVGGEWVAVDGTAVGVTGFTGEIVAVEGTYTFTNGILTTFVPV